jgi:Terminase large subunit, T4likevirus-type, N-terminal
MRNDHELAYRIDPALWVREVLKIEPDDWQQQFLRAPRGAQIIALTARQVGKTTVAAWAIAHAMWFATAELNVIACPSQHQSAEAVRRVKAILVKVGARLKTDNVYTLELDNGARVLALPGSDDSIRGLTVDGWIVADEAARMHENMFAALRPMCARCPEARFVMLSTAWSRTDPFWTVWENGDPSWMRLKATADVCGFYSAEKLEQERKALSEAAFQREYLGIPAGDNISPFSWDLYENAVKVRVPLVPAGRAFSPQPAPPVPAANPFQSFRVRAFR